jgi:dipeptidase E
MATTINVPGTSQHSARGVPSLIVEDMKLYLTSFRMGDDSDRLLAMLAPRGRVAVVSNALDLISEEARRAYAARGGFVVQDWFRNHGLEVTDLDLRTYFNNGSIEAALDQVDLVWATGGNSFLLLRAIRQSGLEVPLKRRLAENSLSYGGWSAGACVAGSSLMGIHLMDDPVSVANGYAPEPQWAGMGLVDYVIVPHFRSAHPESNAAERAAAWLGQQSIPFRTLRDGESVITNEAA